MLDTRDYTLILDKSGSMCTKDQPGGRSRWAAARESALALASKCEELDPDGLTLYVFGSRFRRYENVTADRVTQVFTENEPSGGTDLAGVLSHAFECYFERRRKGTARPETIVVVTDVDEQSAVTTAKEIGDRHLGLRVDVTDRASVAAMVDAVTATFGRVDVLVNNAGWDKVGPFVDSDEADWDRFIAINLYGVLNTTKAVLPVMQQQGHGHVVNLGSDAGRVGSSGEAVYSAAKGGVIAFTKTVAREMARHQVTVNCVCPGPTDTPLFASIGGGNPKLRDALT